MERYEEASFFLKKNVTEKVEILKLGDYEFSHEMKLFKFLNDFSLNVA